VDPVPKPQDAPLEEPDSDINPAAATSSEDFIRMLRLLRASEDLSLREIERRSRAASRKYNNRPLARSTINDVLKRAALPPLEFTVAFVIACGADVEPWQSAWRRIKIREAGG
jgi:hypothetical protein